MDLTHGKFSIRSLFSLLLVSLVVFSNYVVSYSFSTSPLEKLIFAFFVIFSFAAFFISASSLSVWTYRRVVVAFLLFFFSVFYFFVGAYFSENINYYYSIKDLLVVLLLGISFLLNGVFRIEDIKSKYLFWFVFFLFGASFLALLFPAPSGRFVEPSFIIYAFLGLVFAGGGARNKVLAALLWLFFVYIGYLSGQRTVIVLAIIAPALILLNGKTVVAFILAMFFLFSLMNQMMSQDALDFGGMGRFEALSDVTQDNSIMNRVYEVEGALKEAEKRGCLYVGCGAGFTFVGESVSTDTNVINVYGESYHIHSTPFAFLVRYGVLGFVFYISLALYFLAKSILSRPVSISTFVYSVCFVWMLEGFLFDVTSDPLFWLSIFYGLSSFKEVKYE